MLLRFFGADRTVTGSCHLVEANGLRLMLDFGMYQGPRDLANQINAEVPTGLKTCDAVILSHGHLDHCGRLPMLLREGFRGPIYATPATIDVARVVMLDAAKIQQENISYLNRRSPIHDGAPAHPLFGEDEVNKVLRQFQPVHYDEPKDLGRGVSFTFHDAGHILGSAYVVLEAKETSKTRRLLFTGDVGRYNSPVLRDPAPVPGAMDAVITESTYGTVKHGPMDAVGGQLLEILKLAIQRKGRVLLPSFAVGRTQTMLWYVQRFIQNKDIPAIPIVVDSPMGVEVSNITTKYPEYYDDETRKAVCDENGCQIFGESHVTFASTSDESRAINNMTGPMVIIASSPTCEFGRILHHLKRSVERPEDTIVFVGWTPPETLGRRLQEGARKVRILDRFYELNCAVRTLHGLSAHADGDELLKFLAPTLTPQTTAFVVHGEEDRVDGFAARLTAAGIGAASAPASATVAVIGEGSIPTEAAPVATDE